MRPRFAILGMSLAASVVLAGTSVSLAQDCGDYAVADNGEFSIEFLEYEYDSQSNEVTIYYEVCKLGEGPEVKDLSHWDIDLLHFHFCLKAGCGPRDLIPACYQTAPFPAGEDCGPFIPEGADDPNAPKCVIGIDPTTGIPGLKFDDLDLGDGKCQCFAFVLDLDCVDRGHRVIGDCVQVAFKAGDQDIREDGEQPGFAHVFGPICVRR